MKLKFNVMMAQSVELSLQPAPQPALEKPSIFGTAKHKPVDSVLLVP